VTSTSGGIGRAISTRHARRSIRSCTISWWGGRPACRAGHPPIAQQPVARGRRDMRRAACACSRDMTGTAWSTTTLSPTCANWACGL